MLKQLIFKHLFRKHDWLDKTFNQTGQVKMNQTFEWNRHFSNKYSGMSMKILFLRSSNVRKIRFCLGTLSSVKSP